MKLNSIKLDSKYFKPKTHYVRFHDYSHSYKMINNEEHLGITLTIDDREYQLDFNETEIEALKRMIDSFEKQKIKKAV